MKLVGIAHTSQPWRIHEIAPDFGLEDVWGLRWTGEPQDFPRAVETIVASFDPSRSRSRTVRTLFALRWKLGDMLGWDADGAGIGARVLTLRDRLSEDLRGAPGPEFEALPFSSLYLLDNEFAAEIANRTMHGVMHLGLVKLEVGGYRAQMAVLVKPNGAFGAAYMAAIKPFRYLLVYPPLIAEVERALASLRPVEA